ncbi:hypothetical protein AVEN_147637-1 [Araneus ventricosus]|uniref:Integrase catalytic domain-containing protein n=1 Tax=Araneus ventricosus TaxID=182803 RepID=A0A4Y2HEK0_ARAVE|nr:hypothetical protein AVEN_147637-1 [Araneus ventricosus]
MDKSLLNNFEPCVMNVGRIGNDLVMVEGIAKEACVNISVDKEENQPKERQDIMMWHRRFGHQNVESLKHMTKQKLVYGINLKGQQKQCDICIKSKMTRASFKKIDRIYAKKPLELLHLDLWSSNVGRSYDRTRYTLTIDEFSRYAWVLPLKNKNQSLKAFNTFKTEIEKQTNRIIRTVRTDNSLEFCSQIFEEGRDQASKN